MEDAEAARIHMIDDFVALLVEIEIQFVCHVEHRLVNHVGIWEENINSQNSHHIFLVIVETQIRI